MKQIEFEDVCYACDGEPVLRHASFDIDSGEAVALIGPNGAGKSTLLRLLNGLIFPEIGRYFFEGQEITAKLMRKHRYAKAFHQRVGFVWQNPDVQLFCSTVAEELAFGPLQMGLSAEETEKRVQDALELFGLTRLKGRTTYTLSGGEKKKAALASIFTMNPQVWTLDEPLAALDDKTQDWLIEFLQALKDAGKTLIFSTHECRLLKNLADKKLALNSQHEICLG